MIFLVQLVLVDLVLQVLDLGEDVILVLVGAEFLFDFVHFFQPISQLFD